MAAFPQSTRSARPAPPLFRRPSFWSLQVVGWIVIVLSYWGPSMAGWLEDGRVSPVVAATVMILGILVAIGFSSGCACAYLALPDRWLARGRSVPVLVGSSMIAALVWTNVLYLYVSNLEVVAPWPWFYQETLPPFAVMMFGWCALFLLTLLGDRTQKARDRALRSEALAVQAQWRALRAQTDPHFLLNSLSSVVTLIHEDPARAEQMVHDLSGLFVRSLDASQREITTVGQELDFVELYLRCESVRFEERLQVDIEVPEVLRSRPIPGMLLQPLVENAVKHGLPGTRRLRLAIRGYEGPGRIMFEVRNTGRLATATMLEPSIDSRRNAEGSSRSAGLRIVRGRIATMYPTSGSFALLEDDGWVIARLSYDPDERQRFVSRAQEHVSELVPPRVDAA